VWHNGENAGFHSFIGFDPGRRVGVVVLANAAVSIDAIGFHILDQSRAVRRESPWPPVVQLSAAQLSGVVGTYEFSPTERMQLLLERGQLYAQVTGQDRYKVFPSSDSTLF
jgi:hypothetical protein